MKNISKLLMLLIVGVVASCDKELDINTDPNFPTQINKGLALTAAEASLVSVTGGDLTNLGGIYSQYYTQAPSASQFENIDSYNLNTAFANTPWTELYAGCLNDLKYVTTESQADGDTATALIAEVLRAYTFQLLVDLFDAVPYTEALQEGIITPRSTPGAEIYADLLVKVNAALEAYSANPSETSVGRQDIIFEGNMDRWVQFANTLKLRMYLRMAYTPNANPSAVNALLAENNFLSTDAAYKNFVESANKGNPFYENIVSQNGLGDVNNVASNTLHDFYTENDDPRLAAVYKPSTAGTYPSIAQGTGNTVTGTAIAFARVNIGPLTPVFLISAAESYFLQAEALVRYAGGTGAKEKYDLGVAASFDTYQTYFGLAETVSAATFTDAGGAYEYVQSGNVEIDVRKIIVQKWAGLANINNIESWIETTRTKYPEVVPTGSQDYSVGNRIPSLLSVLSGTQVPSILYYPDSETSRNPNITQRSSLTDNVWWDQKPE
jgi:hypothetical protein